MNDTPLAAPQPQENRVVNEFKPNLYPMMFWALIFGATAGIGLFTVFILERYITTIWFPVFLGGLGWGALRNYRKQKKQWSEQTGETPSNQSPMQEIREAVGDVVQASREIMAEQDQPPQTQKPVDTSYEADRDRPTP